MNHGTKFPLHKGAAVDGSVEREKGLEMSLDLLCFVSVQPPSDWGHSRHHSSQ